MFYRRAKRNFRKFANIVIDQIELRLAARTAAYNQNQTLYIFTHDLKNPLSTIAMAAELIKEAKSDPQVIEELCDRIIKAGRKTTNIINELLESARKEASEVPLRFTKLDFTNLIKSVVATNQILANKKNQKLHFNIETHSVVLADENKLTEIADNLINNAIKYSPANKSITVTLKERNNHAILEVKDEGPGLTEEDKKNLFQRFTRLSAQPTGGENSIGLGLFIVKVLVEAHHGIVWAESEGKDKGSKFVVEIPIVK